MPTSQLLRRCRGEQSTLVGPFADSSDRRQGGASEYLPPRAPRIKAGRQGARQVVGTAMERMGHGYARRRTYATTRGQHRFAVTSAIQSPQGLARMIYAVAAVDPPARIGSEWVTVRGSRSADQADMAPKMINSHPPRILKVSRASPGQNSTTSAPTI